MLLWDGWWQGNICLFLPSHKFHPHGQAWLSGSSITFLCFNTFWKSLQQLTKWMEVVRHRTSGKVLSHRHILRVTDDDDCWLWMSEVCQHRDHSGSVCGHCSLEARVGGWERDWHGLGTEYSSQLRPGEDQNRLLGAGTEHRGAGVATSGWEPGSSKWRLIVREVSREPGPDRAAAANPDQRGERGNWHRLLAAAPVRPSEVDERSETKPGRGWAEDPASHDKMTREGRGKGHQPGDHQAAALMAGLSPG